MRRAIQVYKEGHLCEIPLDFKRRLHETLRKKWKQAHPGPPV